MTTTILVRIGSGVFRRYSLLFVLLVFVCGGNALAQVTSAPFSELQKTQVGPCWQTQL